MSLECGNGTVGPICLHSPISSFRWEGAEAEGDSATEGGHPGTPQTLTCAALGLGAVGQHFCPEHRHLTSLSSMGPSCTATPGQSAPYMVAQSTSTLLLSSEVRESTLSLPKRAIMTNPHS